MINILKFKTNQQNIWALSDLHWNHNPKWEIPIWKSRGFDSVESSNKYAINKINELVKPDDILFSGGDLTLNCSEEMFESFIDSINCRNIFCLWGNHGNPMTKIYKREVGKEFAFGNNEFQREIYPFRYKNIIFIGHYVEMIIDGKYICFGHYPHSIWNNMKNGGSQMWCGHSHHGFPATLPDNPNHKILDIGWDGYLRPLSFAEIQDIMDKKQYLPIDKHH